MRTRNCHPNNASSIDFGEDYLLRIDHLYQHV
jgi:hypothetical protein